MPHVFVSYSTHDTWYAYKVAGALEYAGWEVWIADPTRNSREFWPEIKEAIKESGAVVVLMSPRSRESNWVMQEAGFAQGADKQLILLLLEGEVWTDLAGDSHIDLRGTIPALPGAEFYSALGRVLPRGRRHVRVLSGGDGVEPGEYAVDDAALRGDAEGLVRTGRAVWIEVAAEGEHVALQVTRPYEVSAGEAVRPGLYRRNDARLFGLADWLLKEDYAAWEEADVAVPDGPLPRPATPFTLPLLEWCHVAAGAARVGGVEVPAPPFHIGKYPVTNEQFQAFIDSPDGYVDEHWWNFSEAARLYRKSNPRPRELGDFEGGKRPRVFVSWFEAVAFCRWLSVKSGLSVFLPTSEQWTRAARGDKSWRYPWGDQADASRCNTEESGNVGTTEVDRYPDGKSPCGAYDMSGNVWEWSFTRHEDNDASDASGDFKRRERGGSWNFNLNMARISVVTTKETPGHDDDNIGFRLACYSFEKDS
ncbi:MAG: SUMF1/EgtB/PvdO family nonheme iron enzyme [Acidobacteria bacterium]|nr:SUMF1/EgtB/PvdO family nonheme iron enzyme [Acidobacteriota bacterium]